MIYLVWIWKDEYGRLVIREAKDTDAVPDSAGLGLFTRILGLKKSSIWLACEMHDCMKE